MAEQLGLVGVSAVAEPSAQADKTQIIMELVAALESFESSTPVTAFPEKMADKAKAARSLAAELKDDLLLLKQNLDDTTKDLSKVQGASPAVTAVSTSEGGNDADIGRFASLTSRLDSIADAVQTAGFPKLAASIDVVTNSLAAK